MQQNSIYIIGAGGQGQKAARQLLKNLPDTLRFAGFVSDNPPNSEVYRGYKVLFSLSAAPANNNFDTSLFHVAIGDTYIREKLYFEAISLGLKPTSIKSHNSVFEPHSQGQAIFAGDYTIVEIGSEIGHGALIDNRAIVEHHCQIGNFVNVSPGAILCGGCIIGHNTVIGAGAIIRENINIGKHAVIGAGAVVVTNIPDFAIAVGNPAKVIRLRTEGEKVFKP